MDRQAARARSTRMAEPMLAGVETNILGEGLKRVQGEIDSLFDALLPVPDDTSARLIEAMRYAAIGGGKRVRPLLVVSTAGLFGRIARCRLARGRGDRGDPRLFADPR